MTTEGVDQKTRRADSRQGSAPSIVARDLSKSFGAVTAVDRVNFDVFPGRVTGFLGPNGAGKTTTLRMMLGLVAPTSGAVVFGHAPYRDLERPLIHVGAALDGQAFAGGRSGYRHLMCWAGMAGADSQRVTELLHMVGLEDAAKRRVSGYSLGMRQRLALATALLGNPRVLVMDEPANGLDPEGVIWLRETIRELAREGRTVLVSSHMLAEAQRMVDDVLMIRNGRILYQGTLQALLVSTSQDGSGTDVDLEQAYLTLTREKVQA